MPLFGKKKEKDPCAEFSGPDYIKCSQNQVSEMANEAVDGVQNEVKAKMEEGKKQASELVDKIQAQGSNMANDATSKASEMANTLTSQVSNMKSNLSDMAGKSDVASKIPGMKGMDGIGNITGMLGNVTGSNEEEKEPLEEYKKMTQGELDAAKKKISEEFEKGLKKYLENFNEKIENRLVSPQEKLDKSIDFFMRRIIKKDPENKIKDAIIEKIKDKVKDPNFKIEKKEDEKKDENVKTVIPIFSNHKINIDLEKLKGQIR